MVIKAIKVEVAATEVAEAMGTQVDTVVLVAIAVGAVMAVLVAIEAENSVALKCQLSQKDQQP